MFISFLNGLKKREGEEATKEKEAEEKEEEEELVRGLPKYRFHNITLLRNRNNPFEEP